MQTLRSHTSKWIYASHIDAHIATKYKSPFLLVVVHLPCYNSQILNSDAFLILILMHSDFISHFKILPVHIPFYMYQMNLKDVVRQSIIQLAVVMDSLWIFEIYFRGLDSTLLFPKGLIF